MQKNGILNRDIAAVLAQLGHTDRIAVADCGLPVPQNVQCIDVSLKPGVPGFSDVLSVLLEEMAVERCYVAEETKERNHAVYEDLQRYSVPIEWTNHATLKKEMANMKAIIRTGENTPFANIILQSGVIF